jgi:hypothetical protein
LKQAPLAGFSATPIREALLQDGAHICEMVINKPAKGAEPLIWILGYRFRTKVKASVTNNTADHEIDISAPATIRCLVNFDIGFNWIFS